MFIANIFVHFSKVREDSLSNHMNEEWRHMFGGAETIILSKLNENQSRV